MPVFLYPSDITAGQRALYALRLSKTEVAGMEEMLRGGHRQSLLEALRPLGGVPETEPDAQELREALDSLVCFRVYMRAYLGRFSGDRELFLENLDELERALRKPGREKRTVLPREASVTLGLLDGRMSFDSLCAMLMYDMSRAEAEGRPVRQCRLCGECYVGSRKNAAYCESCRPFGAAKMHAETVNSDPLLVEYKKARSRIYTAKSRGSITAGQADEMLEKAKKALEKIKDEGGTAEQLAKLLK